MTRRSRAREVALQLLFQKDQNPKPISRKAIEKFARDRLIRDGDAVEFCLRIYDEVLSNQAAIDASISATAENWRINRMLPVDRNLLRIGTYEMIHAAEPTPPAVAIDEVIELARRYGSADSPGFVNGILDKIIKKKQAAPPVPTPAEPVAAAE
ncbi:transcription antitermination factor NusB [Limnoglobus roseus]|uniref:Transcription antitermination protein NusB n=1 Tax=Limnoglobus roseus TaxID=2598579 RepID=A0A5C1AJF0_9BACT|nr:transcription antitermination factor NusB [Limnoglobus roseus]QEL18990.1 transcription antitermination factor NusB [Limnoglobus roseus]